MNSEPLRLEPQDSIVTKSEAMALRPGDKILLVWTHPACADQCMIDQTRGFAEMLEARAREDGIALRIIVQPEGFDVKAYRLAP